jgi:hypothetical protein
MLLIRDTKVTIKNSDLSIFGGLEHIDASLQRDNRENLIEILQSRSLPVTDLTRYYKVLIDPPAAGNLPKVGGYVLVEKSPNNPFLLGNWAIWDEPQSDPGIAGFLNVVTIFIRRNVK